MRHVFDDLVRYLLRVDGRFLATVRGLLVPGFLTVEYLAGRRERYEKPVRLYVVTLALSLFLMPASTYIHLAVDGKEVVAGQPDAPPEALEWIAFISSHMQLISLLFVLFGTAVLTFTYRSRGVRFAEHFVFMLHAMSAGNVIGLALGPARLISQQLWTQLSSVITGVFFLLALHRVHQEPWKTLLRRLIVFAVVGTVSFVVITVGSGMLYFFIYSAIRASK